jgi:hypothetical protein
MLTCWKHETGSYRARFRAAANFVQRGSDHGDHRGEGAKTNIVGPRLIGPNQRRGTVTGRS